MCRSCLLDEDAIIGLAECSHCGEHFEWLDRNEDEDGNYFCDDCWDEVQRAKYPPNTQLARCEECGKLYE